MTSRLLRGGSCINDTWFLRSSIRFRNLPVNRDWDGGFRLIIRRKP